MAQAAKARPSARLHIRFGVRIPERPDASPCVVHDVADREESRAWNNCHSARWHLGRDTQHSSSATNPSDRPPKRSPLRPYRGTHESEPRNAWIKTASRYYSPHERKKGQARSRFTSAPGDEDGKKY